MTHTAGAARDHTLRSSGWLIGAAAGAMLAGVRTAIDPDYWWHLAAGRLIRAHGLPAAEPFSFLPATRPWVGQQWVYEWLIATVGSTAMMLAVTGLLVTVALVIAVRAVPRGSGVSPPLSAAVVMVSAGVFVQMTGIRELVFSILGSAIVLWTVNRWRGGAAHVVWLLPPLLLVWANLDGAFVVGLIIPALVLVVSGVMRSTPGHAVTAMRPLLAATAIAALATLVNPAGWGIYPNLLAELTGPALTHIAEWQSPDFHTWPARLFEGEAVLLVVLWMAGDRPHPIDVTLALTAVAATLAAYRNAAFFAVAAAPQFVTYGTAVLRAHGPRVPRPAAPGWLILAGGVLIAVAGGPALSARLTPEAIATAEDTQYPAAAITDVEVHHAGEHVYTRAEWGGYLAYRIPAGRVVFIYGQPAVFGGSGVQRYDHVSFIETTWQAELARDHVRVAVVPRISQEASALREVGWTVEYADAAADAVVLRAPPLTLNGSSSG